jgi:death-on-curing protein
MTEPVWIMESAVIAIHHRQINEHGGSAGIRDHGLLDSALNRPKNLFSYNIANASFEELAAAYAYGIARNHPFIDGNKRTAFVVCELFLLINGFKVHASQKEKYEIFLNMASGNISESELAQWLATKTIKT